MKHYTEAGFSGSVAEFRDSEQGRPRYTGDGSLRSGLIFRFLLNELANEETIFCLRGWACWMW